MNTNYISNNTAKWQIFSAFFLLVFIFITATFAQTPSLRANGKIAFTSDRDGNREIYVMNADGTGQARLTNNNIIDDHPAWSPDGKKIAFLSQNASGAFAIFVMNADGTDKTEITPITVPNYRNKIMSWSPDGRQIAINHSDGIFIVDADGSNRRFLTSGFEPAWAPDGSKILFVNSPPNSPNTLHTIRPDGTELRVLLAGLPGSFGNLSYPDWSPDGRRIAFLAFDSANQAIFIANSDGSGAHELAYECGNFSPEGCSYIVSVAWSPDGSKIVYSAYGKIYVINQSGDGRSALATTGVNSSPSWQPLFRARTFADFDGDGKSDISVFRPTDRVWYLNRSTQGFSATQFGLSTDKITPADYDGDGKTDISVYREGTWYWLASSMGSFNTVQFGLAGDVPVPADYTGDGRAELAVYRGGTWYTLNLQNNHFNAVQFGVSTDKPVVSDYDGDGRADYSVYRNGTWYLLGSSQGFTAIQFGLSDDKLVPADYDGDGKTDPAVFRNGVWYLLRSQAGFTAFQFGISTDIPAPADYDGDGRTDAAVYRNGTWYLLQSTNGFAAQPFGLANDKPVPTAYLP